MKACARCKRVLNLHDFHRRGDGRQSWCKQCRREYAAADYRRNRNQRSRTTKRWNAEFRNWYRQLKEGRPCADCGGAFHHAAMQWDHLPGAAKNGHLASLVNNGSKSAILAEIKNCELVCANCHAVRTSERRQSSSAQIQP